MENIEPKVFLIGGAPGAGKTTLGSALAAKLGIRSLTIDDLKTAVLAVTTPETHPGLHVMSKMPHLEYFTNSTVAQLKADTMAQHEACWSFIQRVIRKHALGGKAIVIDGWHLLPEKVAQLELDNVWAGWIIASHATLEEREKKLKFYQKSTNPERMLENFLARSTWFNDWIQEQATKLQMNILPQPGGNSVDQLCNLILENLDG